MVSRRTLVLGGARSGKSGHAEGLLPDRATYVATARRHPDDPEWQARIAAHVARRPPGWRTVESTDLAGICGACRADDPPLLVDDIATWLTAMLDDAGVWQAPVEGLPLVRQRADELVTAVRTGDARMVLVSAEVGMSVVPESRSGRLFRDELGALNARLAEVCDEVLLVVAGIATRIK